MIPIALLALLGLLSLCGANAERKAYRFEMRRRLGHFKQEPFIELYKLYAVAELRRLHPDRRSEDTRNYLPDGYECMNYLESFKLRNYSLDYLDELVPLDACLGYLYESVHHAEDKKTQKTVRENLENFQKDPKLRELYDGTVIDKPEEFSEKSQDCVLYLFQNMFSLIETFKSRTCNRDWLRLFNEFAECQVIIDKKLKKEDSYLKIIYEHIKQQGNTCFNHEISQINDAAFKRFVSKFNPLDLFKKKKDQEKGWFDELYNIFEIIHSNPENLREVHNILKGVIDSNKNYRQQFQERVSKAVTAQRARGKGVQSGGPDLAFYRKFVDRRCRVFRSSDNEKIFDFNASFDKLVTMTRHSDLFDLSTEDFVNKVCNFAYESAPVFLSVFACKVLDATKGTLTRTSPVALPKYKVMIVEDAIKKIEWPISGYL